MFQMMYNNLPSSPFRKVENRTMVDNGRKKHIVKKHIEGVKVIVNVLIANKLGLWDHHNY